MEVFLKLLSIDQHEIYSFRRLRKTNNLRDTTTMNDSFTRNIKSKGDLRFWSKLDTILLNCATIACNFFLPLSSRNLEFLIVVLFDCRFMTSLDAKKFYIFLYVG